MSIRSAWKAFTSELRLPSAEEERATYYAPRPHMYTGGAVVPVVTTESAAQSVAIRSTQDLIASLTSELPIDVVSGRGSQQRTLPTTPSNLEDPGGDGTGREDWAYRLQWGWLGAGNIFGDVIETRGTMVVAADLIGLDQVSAAVVDGRAQWFVNGRPVTDADDFRHWRVNPIAGRLLGLSPIEAHAITIGVSLATTRFGRQWFAEGAHPGGLLTNSEVDLDPVQVSEARERFLAGIGGSREPGVLGKGWGFAEIQISPEESQFLETAGYSEAQCARIYGPGFAEILGYETGSKMTYANIVDRRQDLLVLSMNRWVRRYERILSLFVPSGQRVLVNRDALLEATTKLRYEAHNLSLRWRSVNEIRAIEGLPPVPWGDGPAAAAAPTTGMEAGDGYPAGS